MKKIILLIMIIAGVGNSLAQLTYDPKYVGFGFGAGAMVNGASSALINPALPLMDSRYDNQISLLNAQVTATNNAFNISTYNKYFTTGDSLFSTDIDDILSYIPEDGIEGRMRLYTSIFGVTSNGMSMNMYIEGNSTLSLPKDAANLMFKGNQLNEKYRFDDASGEAWAGLTTALSYSFKMEPFGHIYDVPFLGEIDYWSFGVTGKYILGLAYGKLQSLQGQFQTKETYLDGEYEGNAITSEGGNGYGIDLGAAVSVDEGQWVLSASLLNVLGGIKWHKNNQINMFKMVFDSVNVSELSDSTKVFDEEADTTYRGFYTYLPTKLHLAASYKLNDIFRFGFEYEQSLREKMGELFTPRIGVSTEIRYFSVLPIRFGMSIGGKYGFAIASGFSLDLKVFNWDFAIANHRGFFGNSAKGFTMATGMSFQF